MTSKGWVGVAVGLGIALIVPAGTLYVFELGNGQLDTLFLLLTVVGSVFGLFLAGLSMSARTWGRY